MKKSLLTLLCLLLLVNTVRSQMWQQLGSDINGVGPNNSCGRALALNNEGDIFIAGEPNNSETGQYAGQVRVFKYTNGNWTQLGQDLNGDTIADYFGSSVSINGVGDVIAVGAYGNDVGGTYAGQVKIFQLISNTWTLVNAPIYGESQDDQSGTSISLSDDGSIIAIGARYNDGGGTWSGHVRIFENVGGNWQQMGLDINGENPMDLASATSLSNDGLTVAIGSPNNSDTGFESGQVRVYHFDSGTWTQIGNDVNGEHPEDQFGGKEFGGVANLSLSGDGTIFAAGAIYNDDNGDNVGHVRVFELNNGIWEQVGNDIDGEGCNNLCGGDLFGYSVSLSDDGSIVAAGAINNMHISPDVGHTRVYKNVNGTWQQMGWDISGQASGEHSGYAVSLSSDGLKVAIGAPYNDDVGMEAGQVRVFYNESMYASNLTMTQSENLIIAPNPTKDFIQILGAPENASISIVDATGRTLLQIDDHHSGRQYDLSSFEPGLYFIIIKTLSQEFRLEFFKL